MLVLFFGTVEFSSGVAVDRKVTLLARTLSDLTSQAITVGNSDMTNFFAAATGDLDAIFDNTPVSATVSEIYVDPNDAAGARAMEQRLPRRVRRCVSRSMSSRSCRRRFCRSSTYLIFSEIKYLFMPAVGFLMANSGVNVVRFCLYAPAPGARVSSTTDVRASLCCRRSAPQS